LKLRDKTALIPEAKFTDRLHVNSPFRLRANPRY
jgi:hypothetical protein